MNELRLASPGASLELRRERVDEAAGSMRPSHATVGPAPVGPARCASMRPALASVGCDAAGATPRGCTSCAYRPGARCAEGADLVSAAFFLKYTGWYEIVGAPRAGGANEVERVACGISGAQ
ncbi:hypothetical protein M885DRAFT_110822 [Pelagophyceae sp. CCMP2097]|nr:hypothetical protein M885DRAFT_110822 [Pelagophyceae sp. CCMP2097]